LLSPDKLHRCVHLPGSVRVRRDACRLHVQRVPGLRAAAAQASDADYLYRMPALDRPQGSIDILEAACTLCFEIIPPPPPQNRTIDHACEILLDADQVQFPLIVRNYRQGDRIRPFGLAGTQSLKRLFINNKVPRTKRRRLPLLLNGGQIVWAVGLRRGRCAPITRDTIRAVRVTAAEWRPERA
ncbi:MAG: tRNA lysidine(34) synthetase TilS, partial [Desulfatitalea sp.]|nr:tRNA lysidine(34) synthetase TilS [Desulfatitalea sp.]NNK01019.1 tRNA lysidine(34) synthetase TilS [Desulfatitalea sp.]